MTRQEKLIEMCQGMLMLIEQNKIDPAQAHGASIFIGLAMKPEIGNDEFDVVYQMYKNTLSACLETV
jgi:hypothetical protein